MLLPLWSEYGLLGDNISELGSLVGSLLVAVYGAGAILSAVFPTDRIDSQADLSSLSPTGTIHIGVFLASFACVIVARFVLTRTFRRDDRWRSFPPWALVLPAAALALMLVQAQGSLVGLVQRLQVAMVSAWLILVAFRIRSRVG